MSLARATLPALAAACLLLAAAPADAMYVVTPLRLAADRQQAEVGETLSFTVEPENETEQDAWAGRAVSVLYAYDSAETKEEDAQPEDPESSASIQERVLQQTLALDEQARATFTWTVPEEVRDHNVDVFLVADDGEKVAFSFLAIGDAPPKMRLMAGSGPGEPVETPMETGEPPGTPPSQDETAGEPTGGSRVPSPGAALALGAGLVAAALVVLARRK